MPDDIVQIAHQFRNAVLRRERKAAVRLIEVYGHIWARLNSQIKKLNKEIAAARAKGEIVNPSWLFRQKRYGDLLRQVVEEMQRFSDITEQTVRKQQSIAAKTGLSHSAKLMETAASSADISVTFNKLPVAAVENMAGFLSNGSPLKTLLDQLPRDARRIVEQGLIEGVALGRNPTAIARTIREGLGGNLNRALTISRTETLRAYRTASIQNYRANSDVVRGWFWRSSRSRRTCATCIALDGTFWPVSEPIKPHPRCIPAGAMIHAPTVEASTARWYEGQLVEFATVGGHRLSVTPNHPILTPKGWIPAGLLNEGDEIVSARFPQRVIDAVDPDKHHIPARIEQIVSAAPEGRGVMSGRMPTAPEDFHGDGIGSQVHVINMHGLLGNGLDASQFEPLPHQGFVGRDIALDALLSDGAFDLFSDGMFPDPRRGMGGLGVPDVLFRCARGHHQAIGGKYGSPLDSVLAQDPRNYMAGDVETVGDGLFGLSGQVAFGDLIRGQRMDTVVSQFDSGFDKQTPDYLVGDSKFAHQFRARFAGLVELDKVREIGKRSFVGQVYNLQTNTGWYISNGIITHNCRCTLIPAVRGVTVDKGPTWFNRQDADTQRAIINTDIGYKAFKNGDLTLKDFVGLKRDPQWGESYFQLSVKRALAGEAQFPE